MVQTRKQLSQMQQQFGEKASRSRSIVPATARITNFFHMRKRKNSSDRKGVEVLGKRLRGDANATHREEKKTTVTTVISPLGIFDRLPSHIFDTFAISASWRSLINFAQSSKTCAARIVGFIHREMCVSRFVREAEVYVVNRGKAGEEDPFVNLENLCRAVFQSTECSRELLQFCTKASARITDTRRWSRFLFVISSLLTSSNGNYDHCKQIIELILEMKVSLSEGFTEKRSIRELLMEVVFTQEAGELPEEEMKIRQVVRDLFIDQTLDEQQQAIWLTCLMRTFPKLQQQARLLMIALSPTITVDGSEIVDWRSLCDRDVTDQKDAALRVRPLALVISKLTSSSACRDRRMSWTNTELFNLIEEVSTCPEPWAFDNFIAFLVQEPSLIPIALTARMTHDYVEEAGNLVSAMKTLLFRWNVPFSQGLSKAFNSTMKSLSMSLRREFLSSVHEAHARTIKSLVTSARGEIEEEICAQAQFVPLLQEVVVLL